MVNPFRTDSIPDAPVRPLTEVLIEEHGILRSVHALFGRYAEQVVSGERYDPRLAREFMRFFRVFGERHHRKEERLLFSWLDAHGLARDSGALVVLRSEHDLGRARRDDIDWTVRALLDSPGDQRLRVRFHGQAVRFAELFLAHMNKEEQALFPLVDRIAARNGGHLCRGVDSLVREESWIAALEAEAGYSWPRPLLSLHGLGTPNEFGRLCRESLAGSNYIGKRSVGSHRLLARVHSVKAHGSGARGRRR